MTIIQRCHECESRFRVSDERAGKRIMCSQCGTILLVQPLDEPVTAPDGTSVLHHEARHRDFEPATGNDQDIEAISQHVEDYIGPIHTVFPEIISDLVHIDVHWIRPTADRPAHTLITSGMSDLPMTVPDECRHLRYAELMISLPESWEISEEAFQDEDNYWPVRLLKMLAQLPHEYETWLGAGHTIPNGDPAEPYAPATGFTCSLIMPPRNVPQPFHSLKLDDLREVHFYSVVPLYPEETQYKLSKGLNALTNRLDAMGVCDIIDIHRPNGCPRKKWLGLF